MSKKRTREPPNVNTALIEIYEDLSHEDEEVRIKAAQKLLTSHIKTATQDEVRKVLKRLFGGLCSSRKAARLGFGTALTECLTSLSDHQNTITHSEILDILESTTVPEKGTSGQDERDHYFGRLFGCDAIIKSKLLFQDETSFAQWQRLLDLVCGVSSKKPWLRQECGWILYTGVIPSGADTKVQKAYLEILVKLNEHKLIRTPEGLALWIKIKELYPHAQLPKNVWKHGDPLAKQDLHSLAQSLKDSKADSKEEQEFAAQGSAMWTSQLHFAWDVVLAELFQGQKDKHRVAFKDFWKAAVDEGLLASGNSQERKYWGLLLLQKVAHNAPLELLVESLSKNVESCLLQSLKGSDRYLKKGAELALRAFQKRAEIRPADAATLMEVLLRSTGLVDLDIVTKTKTIEKLASVGYSADVSRMTHSFEKLMLDPGTADQAENMTRRKNVINIQSRQLLRMVNEAEDSNKSSGTDGITSIIQSWMRMLYQPKSTSLFEGGLQDATRSLLQEKLKLAFGEVLKLGDMGRLVIFASIETLKSSSISADAAIMKTLRAGWDRFDTHRGLSTAKEHKGPQDLSKTKQATENKQSGSAEGLALLYGLVIFQLYTDEPEAVSILEELLALEDDKPAPQVKKAKSSTLGSADGLVEILLSFASRQSKFLRRITMEIFDAFTSDITSEGLAPLVEVLKTKESKTGQAELFEEDVDGESGGLESGDDEGNSDVDMLDSDVEVLSVNGKSASESESSSDSETDSESEEEDSDASAKDTAELEALEQVIADTLKTRKLMPSDAAGSSTDSGSDSDADMTDSEMLALDDKLADVFRARAANQSSSQQKKKDNKSAKENITHFKNRVLDMVEIYIRKEFLNATVLELIIPLLELARETTVPQIRNRAVELVRTLCGKCKGLGNVPVMKPSTRDQKSEGKHDRAAHGADELQIQRNPSKALTVLQAVHEEVCLASPNAHKSACSQASILLAKVLHQAGVEVDVSVGVYANTQVRMLVDPSCTVQPQFFIEWNNWCKEVRGKLGKAVSNGSVDHGKKITAKNRTKKAAKTRKQNT